MLATRRDDVARYQVGIQTEARIIDATRSLLAEGGLDAATLKSICERAEVRSGSFYNLFDSKEEAVIRVVRESIDAVDPDPDGIGTDTVEDLVNAYIRFFMEDPQLARVYVMVALIGESAGNGARRRFMRHHLRRIERFADAMARGNATLTAKQAGVHAELLLAALAGLAFRWSLDPNFDLSSHARQAADRFD